MHQNAVLCGNVLKDSSIVRKGGNDGYHQFLLFPHCFENAFTRI